MRRALSPAAVFICLLARYASPSLLYTLPGVAGVDSSLRLRNVASGVAMHTSMEALCLGPGVLGRCVYHPCYARGRDGVAGWAAGAC
ncbi:hypothetical protein EXIGLDRAFT_99252 [Exidia glandulosa HHB12029]|uniref:Secreted protein n=1 Tax=Exidia glandulosa HHB12029 TaxID=1314781 RepID=A0A165NQ84_EXIGL|nr:hypothetical protein EXIGLDRAFT_99252 [Exidia glandulosa HHB12029]